jgi:hypothetical protein
VIRFEGAAPPPDEVAAILAVLEMHRAPAPPDAPAIAAWKLADRRPDLAIEDVRGAVAGSAVSNSSLKRLW